MKRGRTLLPSFFKRVFGVDKGGERGDESLESDEAIEMTYTYYPDTKQLVIYLHFDVTLDLGDVVVVPISEREMAIVGRGLGVIGALRLKKRYNVGGMSVEKKNRVVKIAVTLSE